MPERPVFHTPGSEKPMSIQSLLFSSSLFLKNVYNNIKDMHALFWRWIRTDSCSASWQKGIIPGRMAL